MHHMGIDTPHKSMLRSVLMITYRSYVDRLHVDYAVTIDLCCNTNSNSNPNSKFTVAIPQQWLTQIQPRRFKAEPRDGHAVCTVVASTHLSLSRPFC